MKNCTKCGKEYEANLNNFHRDNSKPDKLHSWCKPCKKESDSRGHKLYYQKNKELHSRQMSEIREKVKRVLGIRLTTIHDQMKRIIPKPTFCLICNENKELDLCSIGHQYTSDPKDWLYLCKSCHFVLDREMKEEKKNE